MYSDFVKKRRGSAPGFSASSLKDEVYNLAGLNMVIPDQIIDTSSGKNGVAGQSPYTINSRRFAKDSEKQRVAIRTRKGSTTLFDGSTKDPKALTISHAQPATGELMFSAIQQVASPISIPIYTLDYGLYSLSNLTLSLRKTSGYLESILVQICADNNGFPGAILGTSSFKGSEVIETMRPVSVTFMDAPNLTSNSKVWILLSTVGDSQTECFVQTSSTVGALTRDTTNTAPWFNKSQMVTFSTKIQRSGSILSAYRRSVEDETPKTIIAPGYGDLLAIDDVGNSTKIYSYSPGYEKFSNRFYFAQVDDRTVFVNGDIQPSYYDGTTVVPMTEATAGSEHVFLWNNKLYMRKGNRFDFSAGLNAIDNMLVWDSVNFFYVSTPEDPDEVVGSALLKDTLFVFTKTKKYAVQLQFSGIGSLNIQAIQGSKGGLSQNLITTDGEYIYFIGADKRMYRFNGISDELLSDNVEPEILDAYSSEIYGYLHVSNNEVRYYYAKSPSTLVNRMLLFDITQGQWFLDTGRSISLAITYPLEGSPLIEFSSRTTNIYTGNTGYSDAGKPIDFKYWTNYKAYGSGAAKKRVRTFRPILKVAGRRFSMLIGKDEDFSNNPDMREYTISSGTVTYGGGAKYGDGSKYGGESLVDTKAGMSGRGKHIQYRFEKNGVDTPVEIYGYIALLKEGRNK